MSDVNYIIDAEGRTFRHTTATAAGVRVRKLLVDGVNDIQVKREFM